MDVSSSYHDGRFGKGLLNQTNHWFDGVEESGGAAGLQDETVAADEHAALTQQVGIHDIITAAAQDLAAHQLQNLLPLLPEESERRHQRV